MLLQGLAMGYLLLSPLLLDGILFLPGAMAIRQPAVALSSPAGAVRLLGTVGSNGILLSVG